MRDPLNPIDINDGSEFPKDSELSGSVDSWDDEESEDAEPQKQPKFQPLTPKDEAPKSQWRRWHLPVLVLFILGTFLIINRHNQPAPYQKNEGAIFGTFYHITYQWDKDLHEEIQSVLQNVDQSLSMFNPESTLSRINSGESEQTDSLLSTVVRLSLLTSEATEGAFDITVAPLVNAWGFGFKNGSLPDSTAVDSLRQLVGYQHIRLSEEGLLLRDDPRIILDCSAVAKGFGVDQVADLLRSHGVENFMVEIGGEVCVAGKNPKDDEWHVGINRPVDDAESQSNELDTIVALTDCALATSGNYRNFYTTADGRRVAHTIDPATGYPVQHNILSATVVAPSCAEADAFATAFMVLGLERTQQVLNRHPELQVYLICDSIGKNHIYTTLK